MVGRSETFCLDTSKVDPLSKAIECMVEGIHLHHFILPTVGDREREGGLLDSFASELIFIMYRLELLIRQSYHHVCTIRIILRVQQSNDIPFLWSVVDVCTVISIFGLPTNNPKSSHLDFVARPDTQAKSKTLPFVTDL